MHRFTLLLTLLLLAPLLTALSLPVSLPNIPALLQPDLPAAPEPLLTSDNLLETRATKKTGGGSSSSSSSSSSGGKSSSAAKTGRKIGKIRGGKNKNNTENAALPAVGEVKAERAVLVAGLVVGFVVGGGFGGLGL